MSTSHLSYLHTAQDILKQIEATQTEAIAQASDMCAENNSRRRSRLSIWVRAFPHGSRGDVPALRKFSGFLSYRGISRYVSQPSRRLQRSAAGTLFGKHLRICGSDLTQFQFRHSRLHDGVFQFWNEYPSDRNSNGSKNAEPPCHRGEFHRAQSFIYLKAHLGQTAL